MPQFADSIITQQDLLQIENILYEPRQEELIARNVFAQNNEFAPYAQEIGYDYYDREGSAIILANGAGAKDVPFVKEKGGRVTQTVYTAASGLKITRKELQAAQAKAALGKGPSVQIDTKRVTSARRYIYELFNKACFTGLSNFGIKGVFDSAFYGTKKGTKEDVADGASGSDKKLWANKTPQEIIADLNTAITAVEQNGLFKARVLIIPPSAKARLRKPYSDQNPMTTFNWIMNEGMYFEQVFESRVMSKTFNGDTTDWFMVLDNDPEVVEHVITEDIFVGDPVRDLVGTEEMAAMMSFAGVVVRHPAAFYIGKHIG